MLDQTVTLPDDPEGLRSFTARLLAEVKTQAVLIEKLRGASSETAGRAGINALGPVPGKILTICLSSLGKQARQKRSRHAWNFQLGM